MNQQIVDEGYKYVVYLDLERFFDTVSHIHKFLRCEVMNHGMFERSNVGTLQGGLLSLLLSNIMLNELDKELASRGHSFVRYADDSMIFCKSKKASI